jgi:hypothetical protein
MERYAERDHPPTYPPASAFVPGVLPAELDRIVAKATAKRRGERFASARAMQAELLKFERETAPEPTPVSVAPATTRTEPSGSSVVAGRSTAVQPGSRRRIRPPVLAAAVVGVALLVSLVLLVSRQDSPSPAPAGVEAGDRASAERVAAPPSAVGPTIPGRAGASGPADASSSAAAAAGDSREVSGGPAGGPTGRPADAVPGEPEAVAVEPATVRLVLEGAPNGAELSVDGVKAPQAAWIDLPASGEPVRLVVTVPGGRWEPWEESVVPDESRTVPVRMRRVRSGGQAGSGGRDAGAGRDSGIQGRFGTVFSTSYDDPP